MQINAQLCVPRLMSFSSFLEQLGKSSTTGWRWRKKGWIKTIDIAGRLYVSEDELIRFQSRAAMGEFSRFGGVE